MNLAALRGALFARTEHPPPPPLPPLLLPASYPPSRAHLPSCLLLLLLLLLIAAPASLHPSVLPLPPSQVKVIPIGEDRSASEPSWVGPHAGFDSGLGSMCGADAYAMLMQAKCYHLE